jgi:hexosaminidase
VRAASSIARQSGAAVLTAALFFAANAASAAGIVPQPAQIRLGAGEFTVDARTTIGAPVDEAGARFAAEYLRNLWLRSNHLNLKIVGKGANIEFRHAEGLDTEGYRISVSSSAVVIEASRPAGYLYGAASLWQLLPAGVRQGHILAQSIEDAPRFAWRGLMLDSVRHFQSAGFVKSMIDWMSWHKLNVLHWHLTDDQGWRVQIRKYPKLTSVGSWRDGHRYGGYYTQEEIRDIVAYAQERNVRILPEIDMPGHATAAIAAYPELGAGREALAVTSRWGIYTHLFNVEPATFTFVEDVLTELMEMFPSQDIHVGGDEAVKKEWHDSPQVQARMHELNIRDAEALQTHFMRRIGQFLSAHGRRLVGWDEILAPGLPHDAVIMSWRGVEGARDAAVAGNDTVLSAQPMLYLDHRQSGLAIEPPGRLAISDLKGIYEFEPIDPKLDAGQRAHVLGVQANIWTEHIATASRVEWMALPRAAAVAEVGWSARRNWPDFVGRLTGLWPRYEAFNLHYADSLFGINVGTRRDGSRAQVLLSNTEEAAGTVPLSIRYTVDGKDPGADARPFSRGLELSNGTELRAATFLGDTRLSRVMKLAIDAHTGLRRSSQELMSCTDEVGLLLEPVGGSGPHPPIAMDIMNPCWIDHDVDLSDGPRITAAVAAFPFNFELVDEVKKIVVGDSTTPQGELEVRLDRCDAPVVARIALAGSFGRGGIVTLPSQRLAKTSGHHDLCLRFARPKLEPLWGLAWVEIAE